MERRTEERGDRKSHKRKHGDGDAVSTDGHRSSKRQGTDDGYRGRSRSDVRGHVDTLNSYVSSSKSDRVAARRAAHALGELAMQVENVGLLIEEGSIGALVKHLKAPRSKDVDGIVPYEYEVEKEAAFAIGLLATKPEHQKLLIEAGSLKPLVALLQTKAYDSNERAVNGARRRAADAIGCLARDNRSIRTRLRRNRGRLHCFQERDMSQIDDVAGDMTAQYTAPPRRQHDDVASCTDARNLRRNSRSEVSPGAKRLPGSLGSEPNYLQVNWTGLGQKNRPKTSNYSGL
ncbi:hypothetical protein L7F22_056283 [Adiantum nelumboides]|nr:hypothetical protein [Adiantum nelumboides]